MIRLSLATKPETLFCGTCVVTTKWSWFTASSHTINKSWICKRTLTELSLSRHLRIVPPRWCFFLLAHLRLQRKYYNVDCLFFSCSILILWKSWSATRQRSQSIRPVFHRIGIMCCWEEVKRLWMLPFTVGRVNLRPDSSIWFSKRSLLESEIISVRLTALLIIQMVEGKQNAFFMMPVNSNLILRKFLSKSEKIAIVVAERTVLWEFTTSIRPTLTLSLRWTKMNKIFVCWCYSFEK